MLLREEKAAIVVREDAPLDRPRVTRHPDARQAIAGVVGIRRRHLAGICVGTRAGILRHLHQPPENIVLLAGADASGPNFGGARDESRPGVADRGALAVRRGNLHRPPQRVVAIGRSAARAAAGFPYRFRALTTEGVVGDRLLGAAGAGECALGADMPPDRVVLVSGRHLGRGSGGGRGRDPCVRRRGCGRIQVRRCGFARRCHHLESAPALVLVGRGEIVRGSARHHQPGRVGGVVERLEWQRLRGDGIDGLRRPEHTVSAAP